MIAKTNPFQKFAFILVWLFSVPAFAQITVDTSLTTQELVQEVLIGGTCVETSNFSSVTGTNFGQDNGIASFDASGTDFPFTSGVVLTSGDVNAVPGPNLNTESSGGWPGDADLEAFTNTSNSNDASFIQFDFVPLMEQLSFNFIMASEEYNQNFECASTDAFAFILTDLTTGISVNLAVLPGTATPIEVTNIRPEVPGQCASVNDEFFGQYNFLPFNDQNTAPINMNGQTVQLTALSDVIIGNPYTIKLVVGDDTDSAFNMSVFIEAGSFNIGDADLGENLLIASGNAPCQGGVVTLDAIDPDATSYTWFFNNIEIAGETEPTLDVTEGGTYSVEVTIGGLDNCVIRDEIIVEFIDDDAVNLGNDIEACEGDTLTVDSGLPDENAVFVWFLDTVEIAGETGPSLEVTESGTYTLQATFNDSCTFSDEVVVAFNVVPTLDLGEDINSCLLDSITLDATPDNVDPALASYQWFLDGVPIAGAITATFNATLPGTYTVEVTLNDCVGSDALVILLANPDGSSCLMNDACMDAQPLACGDVIVGSTAGATSIDDPGTCGTTPGAGGVWYSFTGTGNLIELALCNSTFDTKLQVFSGSCDTLNCIDGNDDSCGLQSEVNFLSDVGVEYFFYVFGFGASQGDFELTINCVCDLMVNVGPDQVLCPDADPLLLEAMIDGDTAMNPAFLWSTGETTSSITVSTAGIFTVEVTTDGNCVATDEIEITLAGPDDPVCSVPDGDSCLIVDAGPDATVSCNDPCADLTATFLGLDDLAVLPFSGTTSYVVGQVDCPLPEINGGTATNLTSDDTWSDVIDLPFTFSYFGNDYTSLTIGANGQISFNLTLAGNANGWSFEPDELLPINDEDVEPGFAEFPFNTIYGAFHDIDPSVAGVPGDAINFFVSGTAPFRTFVLNFNEIPQFSCNDLLTIQQIILYESFNVIDVNIIDKPICANWNDGLAVIGLMGNDLTEFSVPPGRNTGVWEATNESWRFLPNGNTVNSNISFEWTDEAGNVVGTDTTVNVCPIEDMVYTFTVTITDDDGVVIGTESDTTTVFVDNVGDFTIDLGSDQSLCDQSSFEITAALQGNNVMNPTYLWNTGETTESIVVTETGTFTVSVTIDGCTLMESVFIEFNDSPVIELGSDIESCFEENIILDATPSNFDPNTVTYEWFLNGELQIGVNTPQFEIFDNGTYEVIVSMGDCSSTDSITISARDDLIVEIIDAPSQTCPDMTNILTAATSESGISYQWFLNGEEIVGETAATLEFSIPALTLGDQIYTVQISEGDCTGEASTTITLYDVGNCAISQGLSPDNLDGLNDSLDLTFLADRSGINNLQIFNRLGRLVFERENYVNEWRGQADISGNLLPTGTYFYVINLANDDPEYGTQTTGWIYLNRAE